MPDRWIENHDRWKVLHPRFEVRLWGLADCEALLSQHYPEYLDMFRGYRYHIQRADAIRYFILHRHGGMYVDLDVHPRYPVGRLLQLYEVEPRIQVLLCQSQQTAGVSNWFIASKPGAKLWPRVFQHMRIVCDRRYPLSVIPIKDATVMLTTGPAMLSHVAGDLSKGIPITMIPRAILSSCNICDSRTCAPNIFAYVDDQHASSWSTWHSKVYNKLLCFFRRFRIVPTVAWLAIILALVIAIIMILVRH